MESFDRLIKEKFEDFEQRPSFEVWENISEKLGSSRRKRLILFVSKIAAGITLLFGLSILSIVLNISNNESKLNQLSNKNDIVKLRLKTFDDKGYISKESTNINPKNTSSEYSKTQTNETYNISSAHSSLENNTTSKINSVIALSLEKLASRSYMPVENNTTESITFFKPQKQISDNIKTEVYNRFKEYNLIAYEEPIKKRDKELGISGHLAPLYSYREISSEGSPNINAIQPKEQGLIAYSGGLNLSYSVSKRFCIQGGLYYSRYGQTTQDFKKVVVERIAQASESEVRVYVSHSNSKLNSSIPRPRQDINVSSNIESKFSYYGIDVTKFAQNGNYPNSLSQYFDYLEIPFHLKYKIIDRKVDFSLHGGISANILVDKRAIFTYDENIQRRATDDALQLYGYQNLNFSSSFGMGLEYPVSSNFIFLLEPSFKYFLIPVDKNPNLNIHPYSFGIYTGMSYIF